MIKRIVTKQEMEKRQKRNQIIIGIVLASVMVLSTLGFALQSGSDGDSDENSQNSNKINYNGYEFENINGLWILGTSVGSFVFSYNPEQTNIGFVNLSMKAENYRGNPVYLFSKNKDAKTELYANLLNIAERVQEACVEGEICNDKSLPIKNCIDNLIIVKESNFSSIKQSGNCVYIEGQQSQLVSAADEFLFKILNIK